MNEQGIEDIGAAGTDNAAKLYNAAIVVFFEPVIEFVETGFLPVVAVIADVHHHIFFEKRNVFIIVVTVAAILLPGAVLSRSAGLGFRSMLKA